MTIKKRVEEALTKYPETRDSDKYLIRVVWWLIKPEACKEMEGEWWLNLKAMDELPSAESIRRTRQKLQEAGLYLPSDKVAKERGRLEETMQHNMPQGGWEYAIEDIS